MSDWSTATDPSTGKVYYFNKKTRETSWEVPAGFSGAAPAAAPSAAAAAGTSTSSDQPVWKEVVDKVSGKPYYYNRATKETRWDAPEKYIPASKPVDTAAASTSSTAASSSSAAAATTAAPAASSAPAPAATVAAAAPAAAAPAPAPAAASVPAAPLPEDPNDDVYWKEAFDPRSNKPYYYNKKTKETRWEDPRKNKTQWGVVNPLASSPTEAAPAAASSAAAAAPEPAKPEPVVTPAALSSPAKKLFAEESAGGYMDVPTANILKRPSKIYPSPPTGGAAALAPAAAPVPHHDPVPEAPSVSVRKVFKPDSDDEDSEVDNGADSDEESVTRQESGGSSGSPAFGRQSSNISATSDDAERRMRMKEAQNDSDKKDYRKVLEDEQEDNTPEDDENFAFLFAKHRHGWFARTFRTGDVMDKQKIMTFKKSLIKKALLKQNRHLDAECVQSFKNVMSYMGDRKSSKPQMEHATKLLRNVMASPAGMRDELYLQLCKQTTGNPKESSCLLGWELLTFALGCFPPSKPLRKFMVAFFKENIENNERTGAFQEQIKNYALYCQDALPKIMALGPRKEVPSVGELDVVKKMKGLSIRVYLMDNTFKTLVVDSYALASDVTDMIIKKIGLVFTQPFALYEIGEAGERIIGPKERALDLVARWEHFATEKPEMKEAAANFKFLFKAKLVLKADNPMVKNDPEAVDLLYLQSVFDVVSAKYPVKENHITILAALQLQATFGDYHPDMHGNGWIQDKLEQFIPKTALESKATKKGQLQRAEWEQKILSKYEKIKGFSPMEAKLNYLDYVQEWPVYGVSLFSVEQRQFRDYPNPLLLGITCEGALLMHPEHRTILDNYRYTDIVTWGHSDEKFILVVGNVVQQRKLVFKTSQGALMNQLVHDYVKFKVANKTS